MDDKTLRNIATAKQLLLATFPTAIIVGVAFHSDTTKSGDIDAYWEVEVRFCNASNRMETAPTLMEAVEMLIAKAIDTTGIVAEFVKPDLAAIASSSISRVHQPSNN